MIYRGNGVPVEQRIKLCTTKLEGHDACWKWIGRKGKSGYGNLTHQRRTWRASRLIWTLANGPIPAGMLVCHKCDNRWCVRLSHFFLGTSADNNADKQMKNRQAKGERCNHKLTAEQVLQLRAEYRPRVVSMRMLGEKYGISQRMADLILHRKFWAWLPQAPGDLMPSVIPFPRPGP